MDEEKSLCGCWWGWLAGSTSLEGIAGRYAQPTKRGELTYTKMQLSDIHAEIKNKNFSREEKNKKKYWKTKDGPC